MSKIIYTKDPAKRFYVYAFLREDGSPYYVGKGTGNRAWCKRRTVPHRPVDSSRIIILKDTLTETEAFSEEIRLIRFHGRKDNGTGILRNLTDGGEGMSNPSVETRAKQSEARSGENNPNFGKKASAETRAKNSAANTGENNHNFGKFGENHSRFGKKDSAETRAKKSAAKIGKKQSAEHIAKRLATQARNKEAKALSGSGKKINPEFYVFFPVIVFSCELLHV